MGQKTVRVQYKAQYGQVCADFNFFVNLQQLRPLLHVRNLNFPDSVTIWHQLHLFLSLVSDFKLHSMFSILFH